MSGWYKKSAPLDDIVVSSRIRLARNLSDLPFPRRMSDVQLSELKSKVKTAISELDSNEFGVIKFIEMDDVPEIEIKAMVERHVISPDFSTNFSKRAIAISEDESISIMIGEEDHLRIQVTCGGMSLDKAYEIADKLDSKLCEKLNFAFDSELGFLTECPTNIGTGLRASVMLHLPVVESNGSISEITEAVSKIGLTVRGMYGEGTKAASALYQISNQITLGISEQSAVDNLRIITQQIIDKEKREREELNKLELEDIVYRAYGILTNARMLRSEEFMDLISKIKLGVSMGILNMENMKPIQMLIEIQPFMLQRKYGPLSPLERDEKRAKDVRETLFN